jgi:hypothetical protein
VLKGVLEALHEGAVVLVGYLTEGRAAKQDGGVVQVYEVE